MKQTFSFGTDRKLRINYWDEQVSSSTNTLPETAKGKKYYEIFPKILINNQDALSVVFRIKKSLNLKGYQFNCLNGQTSADIKINPKRTANGEVSSVRVTITPYSSCAVAEELHMSRRLIDIGKTASSLAHGVRSPLNAIKGAVVYLRDRYSKEQTLIEFTKIMEEEIGRLDNFISKFLSSSISDGIPHLININSLLKKIKVFTALQTESSDIKTIYEYGKIPKIFINSFQLEHAILNILNNAIESMPSGGELTVRTFTKKLSGNEFVVIEVIDTGKGISKKRTKLKKNLLNDPGRGFGLFITREIVQYYNGHLEIKSEQNIGTSVKLCLPVARKLPGR